MEVKSIEQIARELYNTYRAVADGPPWDALKPDQKRGWIAVAGWSQQIYRGIQ